MATELALTSPRMRSIVRLRVGARVWLALLVACSVAARSLLATAHPAPDYFPDEYRYTALSRSLAAHGRPIIRGVTAHFPALLEPLLAAPLWAVGSTETAYRLIQVENAVFMSLAAVPVYLLARYLGLSTPYAFACALFALVIPDLVFSAAILSDPLAYPLVLAALYAGVVALSSASRRSQLAFVALAALATLARTEYAVLAAAYALAAVALDRGRVVRAQWFPLCLFGAAGVGFLALGPNRLLGIYSTVGGLRLDGSTVRWVGLELFFLALASGVVLSPGAIVGLVFARGRSQRAFAALTVPFAIGVLAEAALITSNGPAAFEERYLFVLLPLVPIAYGLSVKQLGRGRLIVTALACAIAGAAAKLPLSGYAAASDLSHSPLLWSYTELASQLGTASASLTFALGATGAAALAAAAVWMRIGPPLLVAAIAIVAAVSVGASLFDRAYTHAVRTELVAADPSWVDAAHLGPVSAVETEGAAPGPLLEQLFWNRSIEHELLLGPGATATDEFASSRLTVARNGELVASGKTVRSALLVQSYGVTPVLAGVARAGSFSTFTLWRPDGTPRMRTLETGRYWDGWLALGGSLEAWPAGAARGRLSFTLSLPPGHAGDVTIRFGAELYRLAPGRDVAVRIGIRGSWPRLIPFRVASGPTSLGDGRLVSVRSTTAVFTPLPAPSLFTRSG